jgi:pimeloyl-ACP methyl ester carboxylesterase
MSTGEQTQWVDVNGLRFPVLDTGSGTPVLLLHGFPDTRHLWRLQAPALREKGFRVVAPDLRGFGDAPRPQAVEAYRMPLLIGDVLGILDSLEIEKAHIVAHDWGAALAWRLVAYHPERVLRFAALSIGHLENSGWDSLRQRELFWYQLFFQYEGIAEEWLRHDNWAGLRLWMRGRGDIESAERALERPGALTAALNWYRAHSRPRPQSTSSTAMPKINCPILGVWSDEDAYLDEATVKNSSERLDANWRYERITGASHWMMLDKPDELNRLLLDFLQPAADRTPQP